MIPFRHGCLAITYRVALFVGLAGLCASAGIGSAAAQGWRDRTNEPPEEAVELFQQATTHYREGRFESAAEMLRSAYELHPDPAFLYNLGRALESAGDAEAAVEAYDQYLSSPEAPQRRAAQTRRDRLQEQIEERRRLQSEREAAERGRIEAELRSELSEQDAPPPRERDDGINPLPWIVLGVGAAGLLSGTVVGIVAQSRFDDAENAASQVDTDAAKADADNLGTIANVFWIGSGIVAVAGLVWGILDLTSDNDDEPSQVQLMPNGVRVQF